MFCRCNFYLKVVIALLSVFCFVYVVFIFYRPREYRERNPDLLSYGWTTTFSTGQQRPTNVGSKTRNPRPQPMELKAVSVASNGFNSSKMRKIALDHRNSRIFPSPITEQMHFEKNKSIACQNEGADLKLLFIVKSAPGNFDKRRALRNTWGKDALGLGLKLVFLLGDAPNDEIEAGLRKESIKHQDIQRAKFVESHENLILKSFLAYKWVLTQCSQVKYLVKCDDDIYVNATAVMSLVRRLHGNSATGYLHQRAIPVRNAADRPYYIPYDMYPWKYFPDYLSGTFLLLTIEAVKSIYKASSSLPYFIFDDVYETGMLAEFSNVKIADSSFYVRWNYNYNRCGAAVVVQLKSLEETYNTLNSASFKCRK